MKTNNQPEFIDVELVEFDGQFLPKFTRNQISFGWFALTRFF